MNIISELLEMGGYLDETNWGERVGMWALLSDLDAVRVKGDTLRMSARRLAKNGAFVCYTEDAKNALKDWGVELEEDAFGQFCDFVALEIENAVEIMREDLRNIKAWEE